MNINSTDSSSTYTNAAYSGKGFSGMASGIDTESLVQSMLSGIQNKIDSQNQTKQQLLWKQEMYRSVISDINSFQSKYLNLTSNSCIRLESFYNTMKTSSTSSAVKVTAGSSAVDGDFSMQVAKLATSSNVTSSKVGTGDIATATANADSFKYNRTIDITVDGTAHKIDLAGATTDEEICNRINAGVGSNIASLKQETVTTYKDSDGNALSFDEEEGKYYNRDGSEYEGAVSSENNTVSVGIKFSAGSGFEISGTSAGMAIVGLSGTVKSSVAKDEDGEEIAGSNEIMSSGVNVQYAEVGKVNGSVDITLDGVKKSISIAEGEGMEDFQKKIQSAFGSSVQCKQNENGSWGISVSGTGRTLTLSGNAETMEAIGFAAGTTTVSNQLVRTDSVAKLGIGSESDTDTEYSFNINGNEIKYTSADTVSSIMNKINSSEAGVSISYDELSDKFKITSKSTGEGYDINITGDDEGLFQKLGFNMSGGSLDSSSVKAGQNAVVNINGVTVERANNDFTYNGLTISLKSTTGTYATDENGNFIENSDGTIQTAAGSVENKAEVSTSRDVDKIVDTLKSFVEDYNALIEKFNKYTHEEATYKKYAPLTDAQKKEMTEKEIALWEENSKIGLLRSDKDISSFLSDMRTAMYSSSGSGLMLSNIGINSSTQWSDYGKLSIDEDALKSALQTNAEDVKNIFVGEKGLATRLNTICNNTASTSSGSPGKLVSLAGVAGKGTDKSNTIQTKLDAIAKKLESLNLIYEKRKDKYWRQFNAMETALANMDSQSSTLSQYLG